ncbi:MAG: hypothetical protein ABI459_01305 [Deltaproteobacteria bacterium]
MSKIWTALTSVVAAVTATSAFAGGIAPVVVEEVPVVETKPASSISPLLILGLLILIGVLVSRNNDE